MDDIAVAQFIYFILTNKRIRNVINTVANKAVLILGRFTKKRKEVLDAIAGKLRRMDFSQTTLEIEDIDTKNNINLS